MTELYIFNYILCNGFLVYLVRRFTLVFCEHKDIGKYKELVAYLLFFIATTLLHFFAVPFILHWLIVILCYFCLTFIYTTKLLTRLLTSGFLFSILIATDLGLTIFSGHYHLRLFNPPLFSAMTGTLLFTTIFFFFVVIIECVQQIIRTADNSPYYWLAAICVPITVSYLLIFATLADRQDIDFTFYLNILVLLLLIATTYYLYDRKIKLTKLQRDKDLISQQNKYYEKQLEILQSSQEAVNKSRHDLANHLTSLKSLIGNNQIQDGEAYIDTAIKHLKPPAAISDTNNLIIDGLINHKLQNYKERGIELQFKAIIPQNLTFNHFDLSVILGNLIDNAIEALMKESCLDKRLFLSMEYGKNCLIMKIKNTYDGKVVECDGNIVTAKSNASLHGIGLKNVKQTIDKYNGTIRITHDDSLFCVTVILPLT